MGADEVDPLIGRELLHVVIGADLVVVGILARNEAVIVHPASDGLEHCCATVKVIHALGVLACQAFMAAYHGERYHFGAGKKGGTRCENTAEGVMAEFEPREVVAVLEEVA